MAWNGGTVKALCDVEGRLYVNEQDISGENYFAGIAWDDNGIVSGFDSDNEAFMQIILTYGCNNSVLSYNETSATVTINSEPVVFNFTGGQLVPVTSAWQQGSTPMFFYRMISDGENEITVVCTPDGKLYVNDHDDYILRVNDGFAWSTGAASQTLITNCGGKVTMDVAAGDDNLMTVISMDDYTVVFNEDGEVTVGAISQSSISKPYWRVFNESNDKVMVDEIGLPIFINPLAFAVLRNSNNAIQYVTNDYEVDTINHLWGTASNIRGENVQNTIIVEYFEEEYSAAIGSSNFTPAISDYPNA